MGDLVLGKTKGPFLRGQGKGGGGGGHKLAPFAILHHKL